jgi:hypothetical protein
MDKSDQERYAVSLIGLTLVRGKFEVREGVKIQRGQVADLTAYRVEDDGFHNSFGVEVKWIQSESDIDIERYVNQLKHYSSLGMAMEMAVVVGNGSMVFVSSRLKDLMVYDESKLNVQVIPAWPSSAKS